MYLASGINRSGAISDLSVLDAVGAWPGCQPLPPALEALRLKEFSVAVPIVFKLKN
jgi:hypothetical protein